jgi:hypothetical protein
VAYGLSTIVVMLTSNMGGDCEGQLPAKKQVKRARNDAIEHLKIIGRRMTSICMTQSAVVTPFAPRDSPVLRCTTSFRDSSLQLSQTASLLFETQLRLPCSWMESNPHSVQGVPGDAVLHAVQASHLSTWIERTPRAISDQDVGSFYDDLVLMEARTPSRW